MTTLIHLDGPSLDWRDYETLEPFTIKTNGGPDIHVPAGHECIPDPRSDRDGFILKDPHAFVCVPGLRDGESTEAWAERTWAERIAYSYLVTFAVEVEASNVDDCNAEVQA